MKSVATLGQIDMLSCSRTESVQSKPKQILRFGVFFSELCDRIYVRGINLCICKCRRKVGSFRYFFIFIYHAIVYGLFKTKQWRDYFSLQQFCFPIRKLYEGVEEEGETEEKTDLQPGSKNGQESVIPDWKSSHAVWSLPWFGLGEEREGREINMMLASLFICLFWPAENTGSGKLIWKVHARRAAVQLCHNSPNSRALTDRSGRTERL